jgi:glycosyltransferase involved in cell wall biosynthesis
MAIAVRDQLRREVKRGFDFDLIDAHYFYPDGVAAVMIGAWIGKPVVVTARGTDLNLIPRYRLPRAQIRWAAKRCSAIITVCEALRQPLLRLGVPESRISVLRNGVDLTRFSPMDRSAARQQVGIQGKTLLSVGYLIERKGHHIAIEALAGLPEVRLVIVGEGEMDTRLKRLAEEAGVADRVRFVGAVDQETLVRFYNAADALVLASSREGMANVLLECLACGTPVIATRSWGTPEVIHGPAAGELMDRRDAASLVEAYRRLMERYPERESTRDHAKRFGWGETTAGQLKIFADVQNRKHGT